MRRSVARTLVGVLLALSFALPAGAVPAPSRGDGVPEACPPPWGSPAPGQPVLLVGGPGSDPEGVWGGPAGLRAKLQEAGYRVWVADLSRDDDPDPERLARLVVGPAAERVLAACGAERLHMVAHGLGALAARYWAERGGSGRLGTLVMLAPPNHGSFAMNMLHVAAALSAREAGVVTEAGAAGGHGEAAGAGGALWSYVWEKAGSVYQPLYRRYVGEYRLGVPARDTLGGVRRMLGRLPFEGWVAREEPELFAREFRDAQEPLDGTSVTTAYGHALALNVGRVEELRAALRGAGLVSSLLEDPILTSDWKEMARHYGLKAARWAGRQVADWLTRQGQKLLLDQAPALLGVDPFSPGMERVVEEYFLLPMGPGPDGRPRYERLLSNWFLKQWNEKAARPDSPRYVVVAGKVPNLWRLGWKQVGENDFWVEVESCFLPLGPDDRFFLVEDRGISASHGGLPRNRRVHDLVLSELSFAPRRVLYPRAGPPGKAVSWTGRREMSLSPWHPRYLRIDSRYLNRGGDLHIELEPRTSTRAGMPPAWVWIERAGGRWERREFEWNGDRAVLTVPRFGQEVYAAFLGSRLPLAPARGLIACYRDSPTGEIMCRATFIPSPVEAGGGWVQPPPAEGAGVEVSLPQDLPVIRAVLRTKQTTHEKDRRTYHSRWEWDFGDGYSFVDDDPVHTSAAVSHAFAGPGQYTVRARSYANDGRILREKAWHVTVTPPGGDGSPGEDPAGERVEVGQPWKATLETAREPRVTATIHSPKEWMSGRPARIRVSVQVEEVPFLAEQRVEIDPGPEFVMIWERAGLFPVRVAVTVTLRYRFPEIEYALRNTYLFETQVKVLTTSGTD